jgi:hypothetical protein
MKLTYEEITIIIGMLKREERKSAERCELVAANVEFAKDRFQGWLQDYRKRATQVDAETAEKTIDQAFEEIVTPSEESYRVARAYHNNTERILCKFTEDAFEI